MWKCKECQFSAQERQSLSTHYKLKHVHGLGNPQPCLYQECPCTFKNSSSFYSHLSRSHPLDLTTPSCSSAGELATFRCLVCEKRDHHTEKSYFEHLNKHLKNHETILCIYEGCSFTTNVYGTFKSHRSRKHTSATQDDFRKDVIIRTSVAATGSQIAPSENVEGISLTVPLEHEESHTYLASSSPQTIPESLSETTGDETLSQDIEQSFAAVLLKLESTLHVSTKAISELVNELEFILSTVSAPIIKKHHR